MCNNDKSSSANWGYRVIKIGIISVKTDNAYFNLFDYFCC